MNQDPFGLNSQPPLSMKFVQPDPHRLIVLDRVSRDEPDYCVHGRTRCFGCGVWCYLGPETIKVVESGQAMPYCAPCAAPLTQDPTLLIGRYDDTAGSHT